MPRIAPGHRCCWLIRLPGCSMNRRRGRSRAGRAHPLLPHVDGVQSTDFSHTVEFSRSLVGSPLRLSCGSLRRSRRRSGGNLTLGLPGSSTEQPIPWFYRGSPPFRSFVPYGRRPKPPRRPGPTLQTTGLPVVFPRDPLPKRHRLWCRQQRPISRVAQPRALGATSPPALQTETPSCALGLRTATASRRTFVLLALGDLLSSVLAPS
jgi:hypothetical protein